jgi:hypothetical protein
MAGVAVRNVLLLGLTGVVGGGRPAACVDAGCPPVRRTGIDDLRSAFAEVDFDHVIMGAGLDLETRLEIVREGSEPATGPWST